VTWRDAPPRLIVITDTTVAKEGILENRIERVLSMARAGSVVVQLRDLALSTRQRLALGERLFAACRRHEQRFVVNDRLDLAVLLGADGVHLGEGSVETADARAVLGPGTWISRACHDPEAVATLDADAVLLSPVARPRKGRPALGADGVTRARAALVALGSRRRPALYALGGVDASNVATFIAGGADGVAVIGAALDGRDPEPLVTALGIRRP
jgi:thiamine-phosphate pyrophosphorylase